MKIKHHEKMISFPRSIYNTQDLKKVSSEGEPKYCTTFFPETNYIIAKIEGGE